MPVAWQGGLPSWAAPATEDSTDQRGWDCAGGQGTRWGCSVWKGTYVVSVVGLGALMEEDEDCSCPLRTTGNRLAQAGPGVHSVGNRATEREE